MRISFNRRGLDNDILFEEPATKTFCGMCAEDEIRDLLSKFGGRYC